MKDGFFCTQTSLYLQGLLKIMLKNLRVIIKKMKVLSSRYLRHITPKGVLLYSYPDTLSRGAIAQV